VNIFTAENADTAEKKMNKDFILKILIVSMVMTGMCCFTSCAESSPDNHPAEVNANTIDNVIEGLQDAADKLQSYQCKVEYLFSQPLLESKTLRTGILYYKKSGEQSKLRINFDTLTQDDGPKQDYKDYYIFDGQWLTHIDYQIKQVQKRQLAEANEPVDAFELARRNFPIIGFRKTDDLKKEFDVSEIGEPNGLINLHLKVKPDSQYKDDYKSVEIWIDKGLMLPAKLTAVSTEDDIYEINFIEPKINGPIDEKVFEVTIPDGFGKPEIVPLKDEEKGG
jgi:outer membrane lipoprotein-sorting protein